MMGVGGVWTLGQIKGHTMPIITFYWSQIWPNANKRLTIIKYWSNLNVSTSWLEKLNIEYV
jgi:hypothetical protein